MTKHSILLKMDLIKTAREKAEAAQAVVVQAAGAADAFWYAAELTARQGGKTLAAPGLNPRQKEILKAICEREGVEPLSSPLRERMEEIHTGLTFSDWCVAETGSLVINSKSEDIRLATMLSETHVAILPQNKIKADGRELEKELSALQNSPPGYLAFITGPSRTGDIEMVLTVGVHGPQELHIVIVEELEI